ncbi:DUF3040 domain-containing protein [Nocardiopsis alba]|uniref:DUF3040 domain-containing protein n=1 Tax=Nocardiopsis alba TaxID=53437 RepID=UPI0005A625EF|nr:DUF3040 domain-containing protein [Nocardiopsis alba]
MSLREHERRILAEIERQLSEEAPRLADRLSSFESDDPDAPVDPGLRSWKPWVACGLIAAVTVGLLIALFVLTPSVPGPDTPRAGSATESTETGGDLAAEAVATGGSSAPVHPAD